MSEFKEKPFNVNELHSSERADHNYKANPKEWDDETRDAFRQQVEISAVQLIEEEKKMGSELNLDRGGGRASLKYTDMVAEMLGPDYEHTDEFAWALKKFREILKTTK